MYDVYILEANGYINEKQEGYGTPIYNRLNEFGYNPFKLNLENDYQQLHTLQNNIPIIISGGMAESFADIEWINQTKKFIKKIIQHNQIVPLREKTPILGICFGSQIISEILHKGTVHFLDTPQIGESSIDIEQNHPLFQGLENPFLAYSFHYNQIRNINLEILSEFKKENRNFIQSFKVDNLLLFGTQFHPEFLKNEFEELMRYYRNDFLEELNFDTELIYKNLQNNINNSQILHNFMNIKSCYTKKG